jgi:O-antigen/teichoic acid export membrane protein
LSTAVLARLLTPAEFGISVIGTAVLGVAEALRELGSIAYLVQQKDLSQTKIRTVFTISLTVTLVVAALLLVLAGPLAGFYGDPTLARYIRIVAFSYAIAPFAHPIYALLSRDMEFSTIAVLDVLAALLSTVSAVFLVWLGSGCLGIAWGAVISGAVWTSAGFYVRRDFSIYRPSFVEWRSVVSFGAYGAATAVLYRTTESFFYLILGRLLSAGSVGIWQRGFMLSQFPERVILAGVSAVALPAFSDHVRQGADLKAAYLNAVEHITSILWPALVMLGVLAAPIVSLLLGPQWHDVAPMIQIFVTALAFNFPTSLNYPIQVAVGAIRHTVVLAFIQTALLLAGLVFTARYGIRTAAFSTCITIPVCVGLSVWLVHRHVPFRWLELAGATLKSAEVSALSAIGPATIMIECRGHPLSPLAVIAVSAVTGALGWIAGLWLTGHPLFQELLRVRAFVGRLVTIKLCTVRMRLNRL